VILASIDLGNGLHEGVPVALIEAMSYGIPVVATPTGGTAELVLPGSGLLVPPANPAALADAIQSLLEDARLREQLGESGRQRVLAGWDIVGVAAELVREFETARQAATPVLEYLPETALNASNFLEES
jgi:glycosyltransferase involved in cell wall biosynthesis